MKVKSYKTIKVPWWYSSKKHNQIIYNNLLPILGVYKGTNAVFAAEEGCEMLWPDGTTTSTLNNDSIIAACQIFGVQLILRLG